MPRYLAIPLTLIAALAAVPLTLIVAALVYVSLGRPIFYKQWRAGQGGRPFLMIKFRTMRTLRDCHGQPLPDSMRMTSIGRLLRRTRLDELPELLNILRGDMALVGPRPLLPETIASMGSKGQARGIVLPGLTGWAQVNGNTLLSSEEKLQLDLWYADHRSTLLDLTILLRTLLVVMFGEKRSSKDLEGVLASSSGRRS